MTTEKPTMTMPELLVFARSLAVGFICAEVFQLAFCLGSGSVLLNKLPPLALAAGGIFALVICLTYCYARGAHSLALRMWRSLRFDLFLMFVTGWWANELASPWFLKLHAVAKNVGSQWGVVVFLVLCVALMSSLVQYLQRRKDQPEKNLYFFEDKEITDESTDLLALREQAKKFAEAVLVGAGQPSLIFGVDGPWGVGKTSLVNLAELHWKRSKDNPIICRFEPLRYASDPDLTDRIIRDLTAAIQKEVYIPELRSAATRYSRLLKGKADISFLGFKLSLEPSDETTDEALENIDEVLARIGRKVIIVIDDLDRLEPKAVNSVLFATRRTFKLKHANYILCYDTEVLANGKEEGMRAREFLEKFVGVKLSLFIDSSSIRDFLRKDWQRVDADFGSIPSETLIKLGGVLTEMADILDEELAPLYLPAIGDMRKVKRFVNALLLMRFDEVPFGRTDFNRRDLINLVLLHLNYPGVFRHIYAAETEGRAGVYSLLRKDGGGGFENSSDFAAIVTHKDGLEKFLLSQLFDSSTLSLGDPSELDSGTLASRACFNDASSRNLEGYLKLIVRFVTPEPKRTFVLYHTAVERVRNGEKVASLLMSRDFQNDEHAHDQFWSTLVNQAHDFTQDTADDAINTLVEVLPRYSAMDAEGRSLRHRSVYALLRLLDRAGWGRTAGRRRNNSPENLVEIAWRIFGKKYYHENGLLDKIASIERGVLGWYDLMLFRLYCCADRNGQLYNLTNSLILAQDPAATTGGNVLELTRVGMRRLSQIIFAMFKSSYIEPQKNFFAEVELLPADYFSGEMSREVYIERSSELSRLEGEKLAQKIASARSFVALFVIYQLCNELPPTGSGVGCGYYNETGAEDNGFISKLMNEYIFGICFNPDIDEANILYFLDSCLAKLSNPFLSGRNEEGYYASKTDLPGGLNESRLAHYWKEHGERIRHSAAKLPERVVVTHSYTVTYRNALPGVFKVLDELAQSITE